MSLEQQLRASEELDRIKTAITAEIGWHNEQAGLCRGVLGRAQRSEQRMAFWSNVMRHQEAAFRLLAILNPKP